MSKTSIPHFTRNNGVEIPAIGLGVYQTAPAETPRAVETALQVGYRHVDTAAEHGAADHRARVQRNEVRKEQSPCRT